jgi:hypothetical protein
MIKREVPVEFNAAERAKMVDEHIALSVEVDALETQARDAAAVFRKRAKEAKARARQLAKDLQRGKTARLMFVREKLDVEAARVDIHLAQSGELVDSRPATPEELNLRIPFLPKEGTFKPGNLVQIADYSAIFRIQSIDEARAQATIEVVIDRDGDAPQEPTDVLLSTLKAARIGPDDRGDEAHDFAGKIGPGEDEDGEEMEDLPATPKRKRPARGKGPAKSAGNGKDAKKKGGRRGGLGLVQ